MDILYFYIAVISLFAECTSRVNTDNWLEKLGLGLICFGAVLCVKEHYTVFMFGTAIYFTAFVHRSCKRGQRKADGLPKKRKLLS